MKSLRFLDRRAGYSLASVGLLLGMLVPAVFPAFASADNQITGRSIQLSTAAQGATGVSYKVTFTPVSTEPDLVFWFCNNTPLVGASCTAPAGMNLASATVTGPGGTPTETIVTTGPYTGAGANYLVVNGSSMTAGTPYTITIGNVTNPNGTGLTSGTFYGRVETFANDTDAKAAGGDTTNGGTAAGQGITNVVDDGSVALAVTPTIGVTASVLESMTFCVFGDPGNNTAASNGAANASGYLATQTTATNGPAVNCDDSANSSPSPSVALGQVNNSISALDSTQASYAADWAQLSTNASGGAVVYLKTNNQCVGLHRTSAAATTCDIPSAGATTGGTIANGTAGFGLSFGAAIGVGGSPEGSIEINTKYAGGSYAMLGSASGTSSGQTSSVLNGLVQDTTSTYGGFVFGSAGAPVADQDIPFALAAESSNNTPAGNYSANLSLIAVGTF